MRKFLLVLPAAIAAYLAWTALGPGKIQILLRSDEQDRETLGQDLDLMEQRLRAVGARGIDRSRKGDGWRVSFRPGERKVDWGRLLTTPGNFRVGELLRGSEMPEAMALLRRRSLGPADLRGDVPALDSLMASVLLVSPENAPGLRRTVGGEEFLRTISGRAEALWGMAPGEWRVNDTRLLGDDLYFVSTATPSAMDLGNAQIEEAVHLPAEGRSKEMVELRLTPEGRTAWEGIQERNRRRFIASILDNRVVSAAMVVRNVPSGTYLLVGCGDLCGILPDILSRPPLQGAWRIENPPR